MPPTVSVRALSLLAASLTAVGGCATTLKLASARHTPCRVREVEITERTHAAVEETWLARCDAGAFRCLTRALPGDRIVYHCRPEPDDAAPLR